MENFTIPGIQSQQTTSKGWGLISSDEGSRILNPIKARHMKSEPDVSFLCKVWGGGGIIPPLLLVAEVLITLA